MKMNYLKVLPIVILMTVITLQLCNTSAIKFQEYYQKFHYPKQILENKKSEKYGFHNKRQPRNANSGNSTIMEEKTSNSSMTNTTENGIKIMDQKYSQNATGEYKHE